MIIQAKDPFIGMEEVNDLTWIQKKVCKWFKIDPAKKYQCEIKFICGEKIHLNDMLLTEQEESFVVIHKILDTYTARSIELLSQKPTIGVICVFSSAFSERGA